MQSTTPNTIAGEGLDVEFLRLLAIYEDLPAYYDSLDAKGKVLYHVWRKTGDVRLWSLVFGVSLPEQGIHSLKVTTLPGRQQVELVFG